MHPKYYARGCINHWCINSYFTITALERAASEHALRRVQYSHLYEALQSRTGSVYTVQSLLVRQRFLLHNIGLCTAHYLMEIIPSMLTLTQGRDQTTQQGSFIWSA
jgi:hypothetical protein